MKGSPMFFELGKIVSESKEKVNRRIRYDAHLNSEDIPMISVDVVDRILERIDSQIKLSERQFMESIDTKNMGANAMPNEQRFLIYCQLHDAYFVEFYYCHAEWSTDPTNARTFRAGQTKDICDQLTNVDVIPVENAVKPCVPASKKEAPMDMMMDSLLDLAADEGFETAFKSVEYYTTALDEIRGLYGNDPNSEFERNCLSYLLKKTKDATRALLEREKGEIG